jgi:hypothetical protein
MEWAIELPMELEGLTARGGVSIRDSDIECLTLVFVISVSLVYPGIFCGTAAVGLWKAGSRAAKKWLQGVRDEEFLVEMRLKNLEPQAVKQ